MEKNQPDIRLKPYDPYEDEIELVNYLKVLWKWKYLILVGTLACALVAGIVSFNMTKIYETNMVIAPGLLKFSENGGRLYIDSLKNIQTMIDSGSFTDRLLASMDKTVEGDVPRDLGFEVAIPKDLNALQISYNTADIKQGLQILSHLGNLLQKKFRTVVSYYQQEYKMQQDEELSELAQLASNISNEKASIKNRELEIKDGIKRLVEVEAEIDRIGENTEFLISERNKFLSNKMTDDNVLSALLYSNTIQESIAYLNTIRKAASHIKDGMNYAKLSIENRKNNIKDLESQKRLIQEKIANIELKKNAVQNIQILQVPKSSLSPVKPKKKQNVLLAGMIGLFLTVFLAFFIEYISRHKDVEGNA
jgi:capsular polysaccharide biosynthesis protein